MARSRESSTGTSPSETSLAFDDQLYQETIDGAPAARFTQRLKELIEHGYGLFDIIVKAEQTTGAEAASMKNER